jgi:TolA-binding protein
VWIGLVVVVCLLGLCAPGAMGQSDDSPEQGQIDFANGLFSRGFFAEAAEEYERYLQDYPGGKDAPLAWLRLGKSAYASAQYEKALNAFDKVLAGPGDESARQQASLSKGESLYHLQRFGEAAPVLQPLTAKEIPADIRGRALYYLGKTYADTQNPDAALEAFRTLAKALPDNPLAIYARYQLAFVYLARNELENAVVEFSEVANASRADTELRMECRYRAAEAYDKLGWFSAAVGAYEQLRKDFPDSEYVRKADYGYAWALYHAGKYPEALAAAEAFIKAAPDSAYRPGLEYLRGNCLQQQKEYDQALVLYKGIREKHPDSEFAPRAQYKTAWALYLKGDLAGAKTEITALLEGGKAPGLTGDAGFLRGSVLVAEGDYENAQQEFRLVAEKYPQSEFAVEALYKSAECLSQLGMTDQAAQAFEDFVKRYPDNPLTEQAILRAADAQFSADDFAAAVDKYKKILEKPGDPGVEQETLYRLAITYNNMKDLANSAAMFRTLLEKYPQSPYTAEAHFRIGEYQLREAKDTLKALEAYQAAIDAKPAPDIAGRALRGLALAHYERKDYGPAADLFLRLMQEFPAVTLNEETYAWAGQYLFDNEKWDAASKAFTVMLAAVKDYPAPERLRFKIAECAERAGQTEEAVKLYQAVIDAAPSSAKAVEAKYRMAALYEAQKQPDKALELYEAAASANNGDVAARARFRVGEMYEAREEYDKAARSFMRVAILFLHQELSPEALWRAGQSFQKAGNPEQAHKAYEELIADYPDHPHTVKAKEALAQLGQS